MNELFDRFPDMKPVAKPPVMQTYNGIGTMVYGSRDHDQDTGTYVKTLWLTIVFIPILPLAAYRVADAGGGAWYFIGKVPVSGVAKAWSLSLVLVVAGIVGFISWKAHTETPSYQAGQRLAQADGLRQEGKLTDAARICREVAEGSTDKKIAAMTAVADMLNSAELQEKGNATEMAGVFRVAYELRDRPGAVPDLFARGLRFANARAADNAEGSLAVLEAVEPLAPGPAEIASAKQKLLEQMTKAHPDDVKLLSKLAVAYEQNGQRDRCLTLLEPHAKKLSGTEGARILGLLYYEKGKPEEAFALLQPYAEDRLKVLHDTEQNFETAYRNAQQEVLDQLKGGKVPDFDYAGHQTAGPARQQEMVQEHLAKHIKNNADLARQQEALVHQAVVVPVALDLGILRLGRAQRMTNPAERKAELEQAEKTFLAVRGLVGEQAQYRLSLAQVYYWLGKQVEGRKLFDEVLQADRRQFTTLILVASLLRELGAAPDARTLLEEAYNKPGVDDRQKQQAAVKRALTSKDLDDEIVWLDRADPSEPQVKASLAEARGHKARRDGKDAQAATFYREAVAVYAAQPEDSATLNNGGLASLSLYYVTGERAALEQAVRLMEKALALKPGDGILVGNVADIVLGAALSDLAGDRIDLRKLKRQASMDDLPYLYQDAAGRQTLVRRARESAGIAKARTHLDRALILAPSNTRHYAASQELLQFLGERDALANLDRRAAEANLDLTDARQEMRDFLQGKKDDKYRQEMAASVTRAEQAVAEARKTGAVTFAVAAGALVRARLGQEIMSLPIDADELVRLAEEADKLAPSVGTSSTLRTALLVRASQSLTAREPEYAALVKKGRRSLGSSYLIALALWREGKPRTAALADPDVKRALDLVRDGFTRFPEEPNEWTWAMLRAAYPEEAARVAEMMAKNELAPLERALEARLSPPSAASLLQRCWALDAAGKSEEARALLKRGGAKDGELQFDLP